MTRFQRNIISKLKLLILVILFLGACETDEIKTQRAAESAAAAFLTAIDQGSYRESWLGASVILRRQVNQDDWASHIANTRRPLGTLNRREAGSIEFNATLDGIPDGDYAILMFESDFANNRSVTEVVAFSLEADSVWRVIGYYIH